MDHSIGKLDAMALHRDVSASITPPLLLVLLLPETGALRHNQIGTRLGSVVTGCTLPGFKSVIFESFVCELDLVSLDPREWGVGLSGLDVAVSFPVGVGGFGLLDNGGRNGAPGLVRFASLCYHSGSV